MGDVGVVEAGLFECIATQRAMRRIKPDAVPREALERVLWAATRAPSGANRQPWRFVVVQEAEKKHELGRLYRESFFRSSPDFLAQLPPGMSPEAKRSAERTYNSARYLAEHMHEAPYIVIVCALPMGHEEGEVGGSSIFPAVQNLLLAARSLGLAAAITTVVEENNAAVRSLVRLPNHVAIAAQIAIGWPMGRFGAGARKPVEAVTYWDEWKSAKRP